MRERELWRKMSDREKKVTGEYRTEREGYCRVSTSDWMKSGNEREPAPRDREQERKRDGDE